MPDHGAQPPRSLIFEGLAVSDGIAIGPAHIVDARAVPVPDYLVPADQVEVEKARLARAVDQALKQIEKLQAKTVRLPDETAEELSVLFDAHRSILSGSRLLRGAEARITEERANAALAVQAELRHWARRFAGLGDDYLAARMDDVREVGQRLIRNLLAKKYRAFSDLAPGSVILAEELTPADTALMDPARVGGFAAALGGAQGHTAIMARSLSLPAVLGVAEVLSHTGHGDSVIIDGVDGRVIVDADADMLADYQARRERLAAQRARLQSMISLPAITEDGAPVRLQANLERAHDVDQAAAVGATGVGLLRTEFMYMNRDDLPGADEQLDALIAVVRGMQGQPVTVRTLDIGGDKLASSLGPQFDGVDNPALGLRAIRLSLRRKPLLNAQLEAVLRAGAEGPVRLLLPMVTGPDQVRAVRKAMKVVARRLARAGVPIADPLPPIGAMVEVPAAAIAAPAIAACADFLAIGTNDLIMYTLAADRADDQVADYYDPAHPAVWRLIAMTVDAAAVEGVPVSVCGEMAGDPLWAGLLVGLGIEELSMAPGRLLTVKAALRRARRERLADMARLALAQGEAGDLRAVAARALAEAEAS